MARWLVLVLLGLVAGGLAFTYWWLGGYRPLETTKVVAVDADYRDGEQTHYVLWLVNSGRLPVQVKEINLESDRTPLLVRTGARLGERLDKSRPFETFTLGRGEIQPVLVVGRFDNCEAYEPGATTHRTVQLVRYRVLGLVPAEQEVELARAIQVSAPRDDACPER